MEHADRVLLGRPAFGVQIGGRTDLQRNPLLSYLRRDRPCFHDLAIAHAAVLHDLDAVSDALRMAREGTLHAGDACGLPGVDGDAETAGARVFDCSEVVIRRETGFGSRRGRSPPPRDPESEGPSRQPGASPVRCASHRR